ncbi:MAG: lactate utilization protein [bacterium]|nr:lactate utilization protein [bacterium]
MTESRVPGGDAAAVLEALAANGLKAVWAAGRAGALERALDLVRPGDVIGSGGSVTLGEIGLVDVLRAGRVRGEPVTYLDAYRKGMPREESVAARRRSLAADLYFSGTNAITRAGELVNVDGYGNRVAALTFGPGRVCVVAGVNKIVPDLHAALARIRTVAAPRNCRRLDRRTPCRDTGVCDEPACRAPDRICNVLSVIRRAPGGGDITVILVGEPLGF